MRIPSFQRRLFSAATKAPRETIVESMYILDGIANAKDEAGIASALKHTVDVNNLPEDLKEFKSYVSSAAAATSTPFVVDPTAWQNLPFAEFVVQESGRAETWPFLIGGL